ncbi:tetratricopeptide repeat protein [Acidobacteriota bacterium]
MKRSSFALVIIMVVALVVMPADLATKSSQSADVLLGAALHQEEVEGDYEAAIETYKKLLAEYPDNRQLAAQAQFRIGICYEKLGRGEAQKAYQTVIQNYGEQKDVVAKAKDRLSKLEQPNVKAKEPDGIRIKQIWKRPYLDYFGSVSFDGQFLTHPGEGGHLAILNLTSGESQILTDTEGLGLGYPWGSKISKSGKQVVYSQDTFKDTTALYLVNIDNPKPRLLYSEKGEEVYPAAWLSDEELIVKRENSISVTAQIISLNISDGTIRVLKTFDQKWGPMAVCSPDEKYIAYNFSDETEGGNTDINIFTMDGWSEISLVNHPANDRILGWVPGRKEFLFISDRAGQWDLWALPVVDGKPSGLVKRIYTDIGDVWPVGFTQNGDCYFGFSRRNFNSILAPFNSETGELKETEGKSLLGSNYGMEWSPDGQYLAYIKLEAHQLTIQDLKTGEERKFLDNQLTALSPRWSPDGNSILFVGGDRNKYGKNGYKGGIYTVDVKTGGTTEILLLSDYEYNLPDDDAFPLSDFEWSLDGKSFFYLFFKDRLVRHDLETGEDHILYKQSHFDSEVLARSPDGKMLLFAAKSPEEKKSRLFTMPVEGGQEQELCTPQEANNFDMALWSSDGKSIYFTELEDGMTNLWRLPSDGGNPQKVWQSEYRAEIFSIHPDGNQIALAIRERTTEVRVIENLVKELEKIFDESK